MTAIQQYRAPHIVKAAEVNGIEMGVLSDGTAYFTVRGLARLCDVHHSQIVRLLQEYSPASNRPRDRVVTAALNAMGYQGPMRIPVQGAVAVPALPASAILGYYAYYAGTPNPTAQHHHMALVAVGAQTFVTKALNVQAPPPNPVVEQLLMRIGGSWPPPGTFSVLRESGHLLLRLVDHGVVVDHTTLPDVSIGQTWGRYWRDQRLEDQFGPRGEYDHFYPNGFPQAASNPQRAKCYPIGALVRHRVWLEEDYVQRHFPAYLTTKARQGAISAERREAILTALLPQLIERTRDDSPDA